MLARTWVVPNVEASLWLALAVYRTLVLGYAVVVVAWHWVSYDYPLVTWLALGGMAIWTGLCAWLYSSPRYRSWPVLAVDLGVACVAILLTLFVVSAEHRQSAPTLPTFWASASMLAWAVRFGPVGGATAAAALSDRRGGRGPRAARGRAGAGTAGSCGTRRPAGKRRAGARAVRRKGDRPGAATEHDCG